MLIVILGIYFGIGLIYSLFVLIKFRAPVSTMAVNIILGPIALLMSLRAALKNEKIKIG